MKKKKKRYARYDEELEGVLPRPEPEALRVHGEAEELAMDLGEAEEDVYDETAREKEVEDDELKPWEEGYAEGFQSEQVSAQERGDTEEVTPSTYFEETTISHALQEKKSAKPAKKSSAKKATPKKKATSKKKAASKKPKRR